MAIAFPIVIYYYFHVDDDKPKGKKVFIGALDVTGINPKKNEDYIHWHKRAMKYYLNMARKAIMLDCEEEMKFVYVSISIEKYLEAACHAAQMNDSEMAGKILLELASHRATMQDCVFYDCYEGDDPMQRMDIDTWDGFVSLNGIKELEAVTFVKELADKARRPKYKLPTKKPVKPSKRKDGNLYYECFLENSYQRDMKEWNRMMDSDMPCKPSRKIGQLQLDYIKELNRYKEEMALWNAVQEEKRKECLIEIYPDSHYTYLNGRKYKKEPMIIDVSKLDVSLHGRMKGAFGKYGYCMTNPICVKWIPDGLVSYINTMVVRVNNIERTAVRHDTLAIYEVSLFSNPVHLVRVWFSENGYKELYFVCDENLKDVDYPLGIYKYYPHTYNDSNAGSDIKFSLRTPHSFYEHQALIKYEEKIKRKFTFKLIWKK